MSKIEIKILPADRPPLTIAALHPGDLFRFEPPSETQRLMVRLPNTAADYPRYRVLNWSGRAEAGCNPDTKVVRLELVSAVVKEL